MSDRAKLERLIAGGVVAIGVASTLTMAWLSATGQAIPVGVSNVAIAAVAGLAGALSAAALSRRENNGPKP